MFIPAVKNEDYTYASLCRGGQFYWWRKLEYPKKTTDLSQVEITSSYETESLTLL